MSQRRTTPEAIALRVICKAENSDKTRVLGQIAELRGGLKPAVRAELRALPLRDLRSLLAEYQAEVRR